jgi:hypothetical protein
VLTDDTGHEIHDCTDGRCLAQVAMDDEPDIKRKHRSIPIKPHEVGVGLAEKERKLGDADTGAGGTRWRRDRTPSKGG